MLKSSTLLELSNDIITVSEREFKSNSNMLKLNLKISEFHADENITNWLYNIESIFSISKIKYEKEKVAYLCQNVPKKSSANQS